jgi:hypothetical protein
VLGPEGDELARLGTTSGTGLIGQVLNANGEIRAIEATPHGDFQLGWISTRWRWSESPSGDRASVVPSDACALVVGGGCSMLPNSTDSSIVISKGMP